MILIRNLSKQILKKPLFENLSLTIQPGEKIGIVGPNGGGKSTLFKIIAGLESPDNGNVDIGKERVGYLPQDPEFTEDDSIVSYLADADHKMEKALHQVGLLQVPLNTLTNTLSGGQKTRLSLAKVLLGNPSVLLLDEPTNHLDLSALIWLQNFINDFHGAVLIVSHDRALLNKCVSRIVEIDSVNEEVNEFVGNYDAYLEGKQKLTEKREVEYSLQERKRKTMEDWIRHRQDIASAIPSPAMGRQIQMMKRRLKREIEDVEVARRQQYKSFSGKSLSGVVPSGKLILRANEVTKQLGKLQILSGISFEIRGSERVVIKGDNGSGKTTLLRIIVRETNLDSGEITIGPNVNVGYFAQEHEVLNPERTVQEEFLVTERLNIGAKDPRKVLGAFLFRGDDVFKKVSTLSLGQRVRLVFAKLMHQQNELLVLDEPTNHLDIVSKESVEMALCKYQGAMLVVSHDQYFLDQINIETELVIEKGRIKKL